MGYFKKAKDVKAWVVDYQARVDRTEGEDKRTLCETLVHQLSRVMPTSCQNNHNNLHILRYLHHSFVERDSAPMRLGRNQEEILKLHALGRSACRKLDPLQFPEHERHRVPQLHACQVNTDA